MTTTIPAATLSAALSQAAKIVETRNTLPILACVRLGGGLLTTTNLEIEFQATIPALDFPPICVDAKRLLQMSQAASGDVKFTVEGSALKVQSGRQRWTLPTLPATDFPEMPVDDLCNPVELDLAGAASRLLWASENSLTRPMLAGVYLNAEAVKKGAVETRTVRLACANGSSLASLELGTKWPKGAPDVILPRQFCSILPDTGSVSWDERKVRYQSDGITITAKVIEGPFVDYRRIYKAPVEPVAVDVAGLLASVRGVRLASDAQQRKLRVTRGDGVLGLRIEGTSGFQGEAEVEADCSAGFETCVNADILVDCLGAIGAETVAIEQDEGSPTITFRPVASATGGSFSAIIMAMRH